MFTNSVNALLNRQYGIASWNEYDPVFYRFRPEQNNNPDVALCDTPIFACKNAQQTSQQHIVGIANEDGQLAVMNAETQEKNVINAHNNAIFDLAWRFDQMQIVTASGDHTSKLYDCGDGDIREVRMFCGHTRSVKTIAFRKDDPNIFSSGSRDGNIVLWDTRTEPRNIGTADCVIMNSHIDKEAQKNTPTKNKKRHSFINYNPGAKSVTGLVFQNSDTLISCGAGDGVIKIWDLRRHYTVYKKQPLPKHVIPYTGKNHKHGFSNLLIDSSGVKLFANCLDNNIYCYNVSTYNTEPVMIYKGHQNSSFYIKSSLNKEENYLVSGSSDENAYIWNLKYSDPIVKLIGHSAEVTCVSWCYQKAAYSLITCSDDLTFKLWNICGIDKLNDNVGGKAEVFPLPVAKKTQRKRLYRVSSKGHIQSKKMIWQCQSCLGTTLSESLCENCIPNKGKRKADTDLWNDCKRMDTDFGPKKLFSHVDGSFKQSDTQDGFIKVLKQSDDNAINLKSLNQVLESYQMSSTADHLNAPTVNLPNFVIDGTAPHINYSPPKNKPQDWLTKLRIERNFRQEMLERTLGPSSPKSPRLDITPKSSKKLADSNSPILKYFKVTNGSNGKNDNITCSKNHSCGYTSNNLNSHLT